VGCGSCAAERDRADDRRYADADLDAAVLRAADVLGFVAVSALLRCDLA